LAIRQNSISGLSTTGAHAEGSAASPARNSGDANTLNLTNAQLAAVKVEPVEDAFEKEAIGSIDFNEDMETQVFTPYQGKIIALFAASGDDVKRGQKPFTIDSPIYWRPTRT
jgi:membrane fusion protein, heavy metal efflux system